MYSKVANNKTDDRSKYFFKLLSSNMILFGFIILCFILGLLTNRFFTINNWRNIFVQSSTTGIVAVGMTFVIITGGIDLSVGSVLAFTAMISAGMIRGNMNPILAIIFTLVFGLCIGLINGLFISKLKMPPFIVTLAAMSIARGLAMVYSGGRTIPIMNDTYNFMGQGYLFKIIPIPIIIMIIAFFIAGYILKYTSFGRKTYAVGGNREAAKFSGIKIDNIEMIAYSITGLMSATAGIVLSGRLGASLPTSAEGLELDAIGAVVIGGASLSGGKGTIFGTFIGVLIMSVLNNGMNLLNVNPFYQQVFKGLIILVAVLIDVLKNRYKNE
ncbi:monosaccharide ABC transporter membrane protein (CUT2 family) [Oceanotoga teriensis]|jgi:ribose transport system permease protein|uniref:Monosaccharide ABC transporter membrane protein (CUT2 family) n=2 Tax=Oceanotoga teriensis TaxID=515440 RepID=A0AA45HHJ3_9BACT|nr:ABC transporter permease [Oceanotoga teriensis]MDO7975779.1 ABC transporter permease [Oceanotoga teriensis]PWJ84717.1 monosaccharide ABC transporter membrane protein (CUT2 family) [Oceanotoga teriensis]